jgi:hypothetical protein
MGMSIANLSIKSDYEIVKKYLEKSSPSEFNTYIAEGSNGYTNIFPFEESFEGVSKLAKEISNALTTFAVCGEVYDSDSVCVAFYSSGDLVFEYDWYEQELPEITGSIENLLMIFGPIDKSIEEFRNILFTKQVFAEDLYEKIISTFGLSYALRHTGHRYIERDLARVGNVAEYNKDSMNFKIEKV